MSPVISSTCWAAPDRPATVRWPVEFGEAVGCGDHAAQSTRVEEGHLREVDRDQSGAVGYGVVEDSVELLSRGEVELAGNSQ